MIWILKYSRKYILKYISIALIMIIVNYFMYIFFDNNKIDQTNIYQFISMMIMFVPSISLVANKFLIFKLQNKETVDNYLDYSLSESKFLYILPINKKRLLLFEYLVDVTAIIIWLFLVIIASCISIKNYNLEIKKVCAMLIMGLLYNINFISTIEPFKEWSLEKSSNRSFNINILGPFLSIIIAGMLTILPMLIQIKGIKLYEANYSNIIFKTLPIEIIIAFVTFFISFNLSFSIYNKRDIQ